VSEGTLLFKTTTGTCFSIPTLFNLELYLAWKKRGLFVFPKKALHHHAVALGSSGSGKSITLERNAYGARKVYQQQVVYLDAKGGSLDYGG